MRSETSPQPFGPVLIVDDDEAVRKSLKFALEMEGFGVRVFTDADDLLSRDDLPREGCLLVDFRMPGLDGIDLVRALRDRDVGLPAILMASKLTPSIRRRAAELGLHAVIEKPLTDGNLLASLHAALSLR